MNSTNTLEINNLTVTDNRNGNIILQKISFKVKKNSCLAIVGESGSGKTMTCKAILGLTDKWLDVSGQAMFEGQNLIGLSKRQLCEIRGRGIAMILQNAMSAFNPSFTIGYQLKETLKRHFSVSEEQAHDISKTALLKMALSNPEDIFKKRPHQLSGGMLQRTMCALALCLEPKIIIADEPTTALDCITQHEIIKEFILLQEKSLSSMIFISHDLAIAQRIAQDVVVMKDGQVAEQGNIHQVFANPHHCYTKYLISTRQLLSDKFKGKFVTA